MARVRLPEGQQRTGSQGGIVWSRNRYGPYIRERALPVNPNTQRQITVRNHLGTVSTHWNNNLTEEQRDYWRLYALNTPVPGAFGELTVLAGKDMFVRGNANRLIAGLEIQEDGPTIFGLPPWTLSMTASASAASQELTFGWDALDHAANEDDAAILVYMGAPQNQSRTYFGGPYRLAGIVLGDATSPPTSPAVFDTPWPIAENQRLWVRARSVRADGRVSDFRQVVFLCSA